MYTMHEALEVVSVQNSSRNGPSVHKNANGNHDSEAFLNAKRFCAHCQSPMAYDHKDKQFCNGKCRTAAWHRRKALERFGIVEHPLCIYGRFQDYQEIYRGKIDVIITDPPYAREDLSVYKDLAKFALTTLYPGGWFLCLTGWGLDWDIRKIFNEAGLEYLTVCTYLISGATLRAEKYTSTGRRKWAQQAKPLLWYQKPGAKLDRRRAGTSDLVRAGDAVVIEGENTQKRDIFHWQQCLEGFKQIAWTFANPQDVICDPCMGSGTTLGAAYLQNRKHVIGIEQDYETYQQAYDRIEGIQLAHHRTEE